VCVCVFSFILVLMSFSLFVTIVVVSSFLFQWEEVASFAGSEMQIIAKGCKISTSAQ
jgi:hypothetical protein